MNLLDLSRAPRDAVKRIAWLSYAKAKVGNEVEKQLQAAYFAARMEGRFDEAIKAGPVGRKRALAMTRAENEARGRTVRWNDGLDRTSSAYSGDG